MGDHQQHYDSLDLPPGFRFYPTDEEIITFYLTPKVLNRSFTARAIGEVDLNKSEPWELPGKATMGEKEWYFYSQKDRKYPTGMRTNRATGAGYWKATGKDKEIYRGAGVLVGMKKTLVFYKGRAPKGEKTNWVMHEYRIEGRLPYPTNQPRSPKDEWVVCRIFNKSSGVKKPVALPVANGGGGGASIQRSVSMNMTMGGGYLVQPGNVEAPYYAAAAMPAANFAPAIPSGNANLLNHFANPTAPQPGMFYQQFGAGAGGFVPPVPANFGYMQGMQVEMGALELRNGDGQSPMVSQDTGLSTEHFATAEASSVVSGRYGGDDRLEAASAATGMDLEGIWKY